MALLPMVLNALLIRYCELVRDFDNTSTLNSNFPHAMSSHIPFIGLGVPHANKNSNSSFGMHVTFSSHFSPCVHFFSSSSWCEQNADTCVHQFTFFSFIPLALLDLSQFRQTQILILSTPFSCFINHDLDLL